MTTSHNSKLGEVDRVEITSLVDNTVDFLSSVSHKNARPFGQWIRERHSQERMRTHTEFPRAEHGFSMLIRVFRGEESSTILFDTGGSPNAVVENAKRMGITLREVESIVLSHGHYDHFGGLLSAVKAVNKVGLPVIVHDDMFKIRGSAYSDGAIRKYTEFPTEKLISRARAIRTKLPFLIANDRVCVTGEIPRETNFEKGLSRHMAFTNGSWQPDPLIMDDRALVINVRGKGLVVVSGCAHAGIINTVTYARKLTKVASVYAIMGGLHLAGKENEARIEPTISELKLAEPKLVVPSHCTGWRAMCAFAKALPEAFVWNSVGHLYEIRMEK